jgi:hypothetical protein
LDDICYTIHAQSTGTDLKFMEKMDGAFNGHLHWKLGGTAFQIKHYAGEVSERIWSGMEEKTAN